MAETEKEVPADEGKSVRQRNGRSRSVYVSTKAADLLRQCRRSTKRSDSKIISLLLERYGPAIARDPRMLSGA